MRAAAFAVLLAALTAGSAVAETGPAGFRRTPGLPTEGDLEAQITDGANAFRRQNGLHDLAPNGVLAGEARSFAGYLARTGRFSHEADGRSPVARAEAAGYAYCEVAENLARIEEDGARVDNLSEMFMTGWEHSPGHRRNLLDDQVTETGVGVARPPGRPDAYVAVQVFGRPASARYAFRIANRAGQVVRYALDGQAKTIAPSTIVTYTLCAPSELALEGVARGDGHFQPRPGAAYLITSAPSGGLDVAVRSSVGADEGGRPPG